MDEMIQVIKRLLAGGLTEHRGEFYTFAPVQISPVPISPVPIWVGGESPPAMRRAAAASGWVTAGPHPVRELLALVSRVQEMRRDVGRDGGAFSILVAPADAPDADVISQLGDAGVTDIAVLARHTLGPRNAPLAQRIENLRGFGRNIAGMLGQCSGDSSG